MIQTFGYDRWLQRSDITRKRQQAVKLHSAGKNVLSNMHFLIRDQASKMSESIMKTIDRHTLIDYQNIAHPLTSEIVAILDNGDHKEEKIICVKQTPFHPVSPWWPDQPGDKGFITINGNDYPVNHCVTIAIDSCQKAYIGKNIPVKHNEVGWFFLVGHVVSDRNGLLTNAWVGKETILSIDKQFRYALSMAHSACHLAALALNKISADFWRKEVRKDSLGNPDIDAITIYRSEIKPYVTQDIYRLSKSSRKKGLNTEAIFCQANDIEKLLNQQVTTWIQSKCSATMHPTGVSVFGERRTWHCLLPEGEAIIPCGGTHVTNLQDIKKVQITFEKPNDQEPLLVMKTEVIGSMSLYNGSQQLDR